MDGLGLAVQITTIVATVGTGFIGLWSFIRRESRHREDREDRRFKDLRAEIEKAQQESNDGRAKLYAHLKEENRHIHQRIDEVRKEAHDTFATKDSVHQSLQLIHNAIQEQTQALHAVASAIHGGKE